MALRRRRDKKHSSTPADLLVVGLGNPGDQYVGTRHNVGAEVIDLLVERAGGRLRKSKDLARVDEVRMSNRRVALAIPETFMNLSGEAVRPLARRFGIEDLSQLVIVHDELDLAPGTVRVKFAGGLAGHNGLRSVKNHMKTADFVRVRLGVGRPSHDNIADYVLKRPGKADRAELDSAVEVAADAVEMILTDGVDAAMGQFNGR